MSDDSDDKPKLLLPSFKVDKKAISRRFKRVETLTTKHAHKFIIKRWNNIRDVQAKVLLWIIAMSLLIAATGLQLFWQQKNYLTDAPSSNGTYAEAVLGPVNTLNPLFANASAEKAASSLMFSSLLKYDESGTLNNDLATEITQNDEQTIYTVKIRDDVLWHDGESLTADDVAYTIDLIKNPDVNSVVSGWDNVTVTVLNKTTVQFLLPNAYVGFKNALTFSILPKHILKDVSPMGLRENDFSKNPIGSGIFKFRFVQKNELSGKNEVVYMTRNDNYYFGKAKLERIQLNVFDTTNDINDALSKNKVDAAADLSSVDVANINTDNFKVSIKSVQSGVYAILNVKSVILSDQKIRSALRLATDTKSLLTNLPKGTNSLYLPFTNGQLTGAEVPVQPEYNIELSKQYLEESGWKLNADGVREKDGKLLKLSIVSIKDNEFEKISSIITKQWASVGVVFETQIIDPSDSAQNVAILQPRNYDVLFYKLNIGADMDVYAYWHSSQISTQGLNFSNYSNVTSDYALTSARVRKEADIRNAKYITFAKQWLSDVPAIGLYQSTAQYVYRNDVTSINDNMSLVSSTDRYNNVADWSVGKTTVYKTP